MGPTPTPGRSPAGLLAAGSVPPGPGEDVRPPGPDADLGAAGAPTHLTGGAGQCVAGTPLPNAPGPPAGVGREGIPILGPPQAAGELGRFGAYPVLCELGRGGMGVVLLAEDPRLGRRVALKVMRPALATNPTARQRFLREARAVAGLAHDNVVPVFHSGEEGGLPYLIMPLLHGETLEARLRREGRLPPGEVLRLGREVAEGPQHAHERGLVHRDVKPGNVWVEADTGRAKVLDFGLVRVADGADVLTRPGALLGTPSYMAPEQIEPAAAPPVDHRCDLFALGCVLYRACTGVTPFQGPEVGATFRAVLHDEPPPPRSLNADVPEALGELIVRLMAKDPRRRPASAADAAAALRAAAGEPGSTARQRRRWRRWLAVALVPAAGVLLAPPLVLLSLRPGPPAPAVRGALVIESEEGGAMVTFRGEWIRVTDPGTSRQFELRAGPCEIEVRELPDGAPFFTRQFVLRRGEKVFLAVRHEARREAP